MTPISALDQALEGYRKALYHSPPGAGPPDPEAFARELSPADRTSFNAAVRSAAAYLATAESGTPLPDSTPDSATARPDQTGEFNKETKFLAGGETPDPNRFIRTRVADGYATADQGPFTFDDQTRAQTTGHVDRLDEYEILCELGHGGMGVVYKARQKALNRVVSLKMILAGGRASPHHLARFTAEARAVAKLDHPNIVRVFDIGDHDGLPFFAMEFVDGGPLDAQLKKQSLEPKAAARLVETVCRAMHYAHEKGIIHRDLKPANILLTTGTNPIPKITDFGLAKQLDEESEGGTRTGAVLGTPNYMAPEQAEGMTKNVTPLADVYALGATLYELITGRPPFQGPSAVAVIAQVRSNEPVNPSRLQPGVPKDLETICLKAMQKDPSKRYPSAAGMADDLKRYLDGQPILARPISSVELFVRWCKRKPTQAGLAVSTVALAIALVASGIAYGANLRHKNTVIEGQKSELERTNVALVKEKEEVTERGEALARNVRYLLGNTAADLKLLNMSKQREALVNFILGDFKRIAGLPGDSAGIDDRA
jgi:serine/threonine protein kinase